MNNDRQARRRTVKGVLSGPVIRSAIHKGRVVFGETGFRKRQVTFSHDIKGKPLGFFEVMGATEPLAVSCLEAVV